MKITMKCFSLVLALCLCLSCFAAAESATDYSALQPLMDLVCAASQYSSNGPESVSAAPAKLTESFVTAFLQAGCVQSDEIGITEEMLADPEAQAALLSGYFDAELPQLGEVESTGGVQEEIGFIGFAPKTIAENGDQVTFVGEVYLADQAIRYLEAADYANVTWIERAMVSFKKDAEAVNGYRLTEFAVGTDLSREEVFRAYTEQMLVEYNSKLGFMLLYPAVFTDETVTESENGIEAKLPDGSAAFFATRFANDGALSLNDYMQKASNEKAGSAVNINDEMQYATLSTFTADGQFVFDVFAVTEEYVYQAELSYSTDLMAEYNMYDAYLENSFMVGELYQG